MELVPYTQRLASRPISDVAARTRDSLDAMGLEAPRGRVAITGGSRGIANIAPILRACGAWLRARGAEPFLFPAMGSHNGATAEGQRRMLEGLGMTEAAVGMPIESSMDTTRIGVASGGPADGAPVWLDRLAAESAGVLVVNRVKMHTSFGGAPYGAHCESGLVKMLVVGAGKLEGAQSFHAFGTTDKPAALAAMGAAAVASGRVWGGLAILEDGYDQTAELHALRPDDFLRAEPMLLARYAAEYFPGLPVDRLNVLVVDQMGKNFSGTGMDTNVIGRRGLEDAPDPPTPRIESLAVLSLSPESQGNAIGVGLADVIPRSMAESIDAAKTRLNAETAGGPKKARIPLVLPDERAVLDWLLAERGPTRWARIPNTLQLGRVLVSPDLLEELHSAQ